ncbi:hypothetical protein [Polaribacter sp. Hel_I_88]|uniref:hypothetical protein n=1 Tax=Polaribacter sp. Hel_I_88 TaxID=1250006 RepID=UPI00047C2B0B|nr:hypothetical protein [Polaribacter sp. Hel_I_88]
MEDNFNNFFSETDFDFQEPQAGHKNRFEQKLNQSKKTTKVSWKWLSVAASVFLVLGFWLGNTHQKKQVKLADTTPKIEKVQDFFVATINQKLKKVEGNRSLETEMIIEQALNELEDLEESYIVSLTELNIEGEQTKSLLLMIKNYQQRLVILESLLKQIEQIKNPSFIEDNTFI